MPAVQGVEQSSPDERLLIVGAGPAGLAASAAARDLDPLVIEAGSSSRLRNSAVPGDLVQGVGGAGLYSDGKFSFWPSATRLWWLERRLLEPAYGWFSSEVDSLGVSAPPFPSSIAASDIAPSRTDRMPREKYYVSATTSLGARADLVDRLAASPARIWTDTRVQWLAWSNSGYWTATLDTGASVTAGAVLLATGRYGPLLASAILPASHLKFGRFEYGVRIEQEAARFFLARHKQVDPKLVWSDPEQQVEWRTFCCCRRGAVVTTRFGSMTTVSGRADCDPSGLSNIGFNVRLHNQETSAVLWDQLRLRLEQLDEPLRQSVEEFLHAVERNRAEGLAGVLGPILSARLASGLGRLLSSFPDSGLETATLVGPTVEGVSRYPAHSCSLATRSSRLWVAGDVTGSFRGLMAAMVSGHIAGSAIVQGG